MSHDAHVDDLAMHFDARTHGAGFPPEDIPEAAELAIEFLAERGLIGDRPAVVHVLTDRWHGSTAVRAVTAGLLDAQMVARRLACTRVRAPQIGSEWVTGKDEQGQKILTWTAVVGGRPAGEYTITVTPVS